MGYLMTPFQLHKLFSVEFDEKMIMYFMYCEMRMMAVGVIYIYFMLS